MNRSKAKARASCRSGAALVIVLAFVALLTGLIIAFLVLSTTERQLANSSVTTAKADQLATSALALIVGDLKQEIVNGSIYQAGSAGTTTNYEAAFSTNMVPRPAGIAALTNVVPDPLPNLVRISKYQDVTGTPSTSAPMVGSQASNLSSTSVSLNGRSISTKTWNQHYLLPRNSPGSATFDPTPSGAFIPPDWVYVTSSGRQVLTAPAKAVVGRYAYAIYDEGGLLNLNAAGYPTTGTLAQTGGKGNVAYADLSMLTNGATSVTSAQITQVINTLVGWRNYASAQPSGNFASGFSFSSAAANNYISNIVATNAASGFLKVASLSTASGNTDQAFLSRQQLIDFWTAKGFPPDLLQYVSMFSRDANAAPTWSPSYDASSLGGGTGYNYKSNADNSTTPPLNPDMLFWRFSANTPLTNYDLNGNQTTVLALKGDPIVRRRFCLQRINLLTYQGPNPNIPNAAAAIKQYFGLVWGTNAGGQSCWVYTSASPNYSISNLPTSIMSLASVAAENREPDFFELLQAGILSGSIGVDGGGASNGSSNGLAGETQAWDQTAGFHVLQIGANVIDQYTSDNYPTEIAANFNLGTAPGTPGALTSVYGVKNLPYLYAVYLAIFRYQNPDPHVQIGSWFIPEIWNPHQQPVTAIGPGPSQFRFVAHGTAQMKITCPTPNEPEHYITNAPSYDSVLGPSVTLDNDTNGVAFTGTVNATEPVLLDQSNASSTTADDLVTTAQMTFTTGWSSNSPSSGPGISPAPPLAPLTVNSHNHVGLFCGNLTDPLPAYDNDTNIAFYTQATLTPNATTFYLQYLDSSTPPVWRTYCVMKSLKNSTHSQAYADLFSNQGSTYVTMKSDPRTDRFSVSEIYQSYAGSGGQTNGAGLPNKTWWSTVGASGDTAAYYTSTNGNFVYGGSGSINGFVNNNNNTWQFSENRNPPTTKGNSAATEYYTDLDGIYRRAEGAYATAGRLDGHPLAKSNSASRPVILCRPFRNVGEMGYAFRDMPWKNIDFFTPESADSGLLDLFTVDDVDDVAMTAGRVSLNTRQAPVLAALLNGATEIEPVTGSSTLINATDAKNLANAIVSASSTAPFMSRAELVNRFKSPTDADTRSFISTLTTLPFANSTSSPDPNTIKSQHESVVRALGDATTTRTWSLMIDVIAQTGHYPPGSNSLAQFVVDGERRYWLHVAIDRYTGAVIDSVLEPVYE